MKRVNILNVKICAGNLKSSVEFLFDHLLEARGSYICFSNVHTTVMAAENPEYKAIQNNSFMSLPDGKPLSIIGKRRGFSEMDRVSGPDFMEEILRISEKNKCKHYFYGNTKENLEVLIDYLNLHYPNLDIVGYEASVFRDLTRNEEEEIIERINTSHADFVWVGLGAPKQEIFCSRICKRTKSVLVGVGGAFNVICGIIPRAPKWMQKCCLEWFYRWMKEPRRLFKRYFVTNIKFIYMLCKKNKEQSK